MELERLMFYPNYIIYKIDKVETDWDGNIAIYGQVFDLEEKKIHNVENLGILEEELNNYLKVLNEKIKNYEKALDK